VSICDPGVVDAIDGIPGNYTRRHI
jgi:hypothetical protein